MLNYDAELIHHHGALVAEFRIRNEDRVLDIGCGTGETTRVAAQAAESGFVVGIDPSDAALRNARQLTRDAHIRNARYIRGDAQCLPFQREAFDVVISRFGTMFFSDPQSAFRSIHETLRPNARLVMMVWQAAKHNEWAVEIHRAITGDNSALPNESELPAFSLGGAITTTNLLHEAGFVDVTMRAVNAPVYYGQDESHAFEFVSRFADVSNATRSASVSEREHMRTRMRAVLAAHKTHDGVWFDAQSWIVTALRSTR